MNKKQKQLLNTYFRKRNIGVEREWHDGADYLEMTYGYEPYEITEYTVKNFGVDATHMDKSDGTIEKFMAYGIDKAMQFFDEGDIEEYLTKTPNLLGLAIKRPDYIPRFGINKILYKHPSELYSVVYNNPDALKYLNNETIARLELFHVAIILGKHPHLYEEYFSHIPIEDLIYNKNNFVNSLKSIVLVSDSSKVINQIKPYLRITTIVEILSKKPDLWKHFFNEILDEIEYVKSYSSSIGLMDNRKNPFWITMLLLNKDLVYLIKKVWRFDFNTIPDELLSLIKKYNPIVYNKILEVL